MRLFRVGCLFLVIACCALYGLVISRPADKHAAEVDAALAASAKRQAERLPKLKDPATNGFLNPVLLSFWSSAKGPNTSVKDTVTGWSKNFSSQGKGGPVDHAGLLKAKDPGYLVSRGAFIRLVPDIARAVSMPVFQPINEDFNRPTSFFNEEALTNLVLGLNGYAESMVAEGHDDQAALVYEVVFRLGFLMSDDVGMVYTLVGVSAQALGFQSFVNQLGPDSQLSPKQWAGLSLALINTVPTPITLMQAIENDLSIGSAYMDRPRADIDSAYLRGFYLLPGLQARDRRIYRNRMGDILAEARSGRVSLSDGPVSWSAFLKGEASTATQVLSPDYQRQSARLILHEAKMGGLAAFTGVMAYKTKYGRLPKALGDLDGLGLNAPGGVPWGKVKGFDYQVKEGGAVIAVAVPAATFTQAGLDPAEAGRLEAANSPYFGLRAGGFFFNVPATAGGRSADPNTP